MKREPGQIDVLAGETDLVHGGFVGRHLDNRLRIGQAPEIFGVEFVFAGVERSGETPSAASSPGNDLHLLRARFFEQMCPRRAFDGRTERRQRHRLVVNLHLIHRDQPVNKSAQPVFFHVDIGLRLHMPIQCSSAHRAYHESRYQGHAGHVIA